MAVATASDMKIYNELFFTGQTEVIQQVVDVWNAKSLNTLMLRPRALKGDYEQRSFFKEIASLVSRRDTTSTAAATALKITQDEFIGVKLNRKIGPVRSTLDAFKKIGADSATFSLNFGRQSAVAVLQDYVDSALRALVAALRGVTALTYDAADLPAGSTTTMTHTHLANGLANFGDASARVVAWVMHSKVFWDLIKQALTDKIDGIASMAIAQAQPGTFNRPVLITDSAALKETTGSSETQYMTLGLVEDAAIVDQSEEEQIESDLDLTTENIEMIIKGDYAFNLQLKGLKWDTTNGGTNPTNAALGTSTNWDVAATDNRSLPGILIITD